MEPITSKFLHAKGKKLGLPIGGTFELTPRCNFNCKMCYVHLTAEEQQQRGKELTAAQWLQLGDEAVKAGTVFLLLTGGEPTLRPDFPEIYQGLKEKGFALSINSNGLLLEGDLLKLLCSNPPTRINISLYGMSNETYERQCGLPVYDRIIHNIETLREAGVDVKVNMSVTPDNVDDLQAVCDKTRELGVHMQSTPYMFPPIRLHPELCGQNYRMEPEKAGVTMADYEARYGTEQQLRRRYDALLQGKRLEEESDDDCDREEGNGMLCRGGITTFWLDWDGKMTPCGQMIEPAFDVLSLGFAEAWKRTKEATAAIRLPVECANCSIQDICHPCAAMCYCETGSFGKKPEYVCRMRHAYFARMTELCRAKFGGD